MENKEKQNYNQTLIKMQQSDWLKAQSRASLTVPQIVTTCDNLKLFTDILDFLNLYQHAKIQANSSIRS